MAADPELPVEGSTEVDLPLEELWTAFADAGSWPSWNRCFARVWVPGGRLREGRTFFWLFNPIDPRYPYRLPAVARIVEWREREQVTWEVRLPGFHARHSYLLGEAGPGRSRFGSWEVASGPMYRLLRRFWLAHFRFVCRESLAGAAELAGRGAGVRLEAHGERGGRPPLLAVPGIDGSIGSIAPIVERLAARRQVVVADYSGEHNATLEGLAAEIAERAGELGEVDLLGQSIGTLIAARAAAGGRLKVRRAVLIGTFTRVRDPLVRASTALSAVTPAAVQRWTVGPLMRLVCGPVGDGDRHPFFAAARAAEPAGSRKRTGWQVGRDFAPVLRGLGAPVLALLGARDRFPAGGNAARVRDALAGRGEVVEIPDAGHVLLPSPAIDRAVREIEAFLG